MAIVLSPVPPLDAFKVPDNVTTPDEAAFGKNPVVPALNVVTPAVPVEVIVTTPVDPEMLIPDPALIPVTPVLATVIAPVDPLTLIPVPAESVVTPLFEIVIVPDPLATEIPVPGVMVDSTYPVPFPMGNWPFVGVADNPVPPCEMLRIPLNVTIPVDGVLGAKPVVPADQLETPALPPPPLMFPPMIFP